MTLKPLFPPRSRLVDAERKRRRRAKLHAIWDCGWEGTVDLRRHKPTFDKSLLVLNGRRLPAWHSEKDVDSGRAPNCQLLLQGHSGLTAPSPTDAIGLSHDPQIIDNMIAVFGQDPSGLPLRWAVLCADAHDKTNLSSAISRACNEKLE